MRSWTALLGVLALLTAACGNVTDLLDGETGDGAAAVEVGGGEGPAPGPAGDGDDATDADTSAGVTDGATVAQPSGPDGVETIRAGDAGEVDVRVVDGRRLELVEVREAAGWTHLVDDVERTEVEVDFRSDDGRELEVEIELEGGRLDVEVG